METLHLSSSSIVIVLLSLLNYSDPMIWMLSLMRKSLETSTSQFQLKEWYTFAQKKEHQAKKINKLDVVPTEFFSLSDWM